MGLQDEGRGCGAHTADCRVFDPYSWLRRFGEAGGHLLIVGGKVIIGHDFSDNPAANSDVATIMREASDAPAGAIRDAIWSRWPTASGAEGLVDIFGLLDTGGQVPRCPE